MSWRVTPLVSGYPGTSSHHGGLGWSSVSLLHDGERHVLVDTGPFAYRDILDERLAEAGVAREQIDAILLTHCHWDHIANVNLFPDATVFVSGRELDWALRQPIGTWFVPELQVAELAHSERVVTFGEHAEVLPGVHTLPTPGHTPGHTAYVVDHGTADSLFVGDAVKNLQELESGEASATLDPSASRRSINEVRQRLRNRTGTTLHFGHDAFATFDGQAVRRVGELQASIRSFVGSPGHVVDWPLA